MACPVKPLTKIEKSERAKLVKRGHAIITKIGVDSRELGAVLAELHDKQYYRDLNQTFEGFVTNEFGISRYYAHRLMQWAALPMGNKVANERQARELFRLDSEEEQQQAIAIAEADGQPLTAAKLRTAVDVLSECQSDDERRALVTAFESNAKAAVNTPRHRDDGRELVRRIVAKLNHVRKLIRKLADSAEPAEIALDALIRLVEGSSEV